MFCEHQLVTSEKLLLSLMRKLELFRFLCGAVHSVILYCVRWQSVRLCMNESVTRVCKLMQHQIAISIYSYVIGVVAFAVLHYRANKFGPGAFESISVSQIYNGTCGCCVYRK